MEIESLICPDIYEETPAIDEFEYSKDEEEIVAVKQISILSPEK